MFNANCIQQLRDKNDISDPIQFAPKTQQWHPKVLSYHSHVAAGRIGLGSWTISTRQLISYHVRAATYSDVLDADTPHASFILLVLACTPCLSCAACAGLHSTCLSWAALHCALSLCLQTHLLELSDEKWAYWHDGSAVTPGCTERCNRIRWWQQD